MVYVCWQNQGITATCVRFCDEEFYVSFHSGDDTGDAEMTEEYEVPTYRYESKQYYLSSYMLHGGQHHFFLDDRIP